MHIWPANNCGLIFVDTLLKQLNRCQKWNKLLGYILHTLGCWSFHFHAILRNMIFSSLLLLNSRGFWDFENEIDSVQTIQQSYKADDKKCIQCLATVSRSAITIILLLKIFVLDF